jgi:hypothetical protein
MLKLRMGGAVSYYRISYTISLLPPFVFVALRGVSTRFLANNDFETFFEKFL